MESQTGLSGGGGGPGVGRGGRAAAAAAVIKTFYFAKLGTRVVSFLTPPLTLSISPYA